MDVSQKAAEARTLLASQAFQAIVEDIRGDAVKVFLRSEANADEISAAHDRVRAVQFILDAIQARLNAEAIQEKRNQHRGND